MAKLIGTTCSTTIMFAQSGPSRKMNMSVFSLENIYRAYLDCRKNKRNKHDALEFEFDADENLFKLCCDLQNRTYHPSTSVCFINKKPKLREIFAAHFQDRVVHHLLVRYLEKIWEPIFIFDSYASRQNKGTHLAVKRLKKFTQKVTNNSSIPAYYMHLDIKNFFLSIDKRVLFELITNRKMHKNMKWLTHVLIFHDPTKDYELKTSRSLLNKVPAQKSLFGDEDEKGLPIGNLTSQFFANVYLNGFDQFIKHELKCRFYMRYVDDFILIHKNKEILNSWKKPIKGYLKNYLNLKINESVTKIQPISNGIDFLGYIVRPKYTLVRRRVINNLKEKLYKYKKILISNHDNIKKISYNYEILENLYMSMNSYLSHMSHANSNNLIKSIFTDYPFLLYYFGLNKNNKLKRLYVPPRNFRNLRSQYYYFLKQNIGNIIFFQIGCFYEFFQYQAEFVSDILNLKMINPKYSFSNRCGFGVKALYKYVDMVIKSGFSVVIINQTGYYNNYIAERKIHLRYIVEEK